MDSTTFRLLRSILPPGTHQVFFAACVDLDYVVLCIFSLLMIDFVLPGTGIYFVSCCCSLVIITRSKLNLGGTLGCSEDKAFRTAAPF